MFKLSGKAREELTAFFAGKEVSPIRVFLASGGCGGPNMALAMDDPKENDEVIQVDGLKFLVDKQLWSEAAPIKIDVTYTGFIIESSIPLNSEKCSCEPSGCSCDGGSCDGCH